MKILVNKNNPAIRITAPEIKEYIGGYEIAGIAYCAKELWTLVEQEQENVAERFARIVRGNLIGIDKEVQQKFEQLYFEVTGNKMYGGYND